MGHFSWNRSGFHFCHKERYRSSCGSDPWPSDWRRLGASPADLVGRVFLANETIVENCCWQNERMKNDRRASGSGRRPEWKHACLLETSGLTTCPKSISPSYSLHYPSMLCSALSHDLLTGLNRWRGKLWARKNAFDAIISDFRVEFIIHYNAIISTPSLLEKWLMQLSSRFLAQGGAILVSRKLWKQLFVSTKSLNINWISIL